MRSKPFLFVLLAVSIPATVLHATVPANAEQEYQQERKIALRDPKVRGAYDEADRKLEAKILQIDPALADYVHHRSSAPVAVSTPEPKKPEVHNKPFLAPSAASGMTYVVKTGDTLGAIASRYHVSVASVKSANHIADEKKLAVGQTLNIPQH